MSDVYLPQLDQAISEVRATQRLINELHDNVDRARRDISAVDGHVGEVDYSLAALAKEFHEYVHQDTLRQNKQEAQNERSALNDQLEREFGHYREIRHRTLGILEASDYGIIRMDDLITFASESFVDSPKYWLSAALMALVSWMNDDRENAGVALGRAMELDDEKSSLMFGLICRRSHRDQASLVWIRRFLRDQDPDRINTAAEVIVNAYAAGLFPNDSEGIVLRELRRWLRIIQGRKGFEDGMRRKWSEAFAARRPHITQNKYPYLAQYSPTWGSMKTALEWSMLHGRVYDYFEDIFSQPVSRQEVREQLDEELKSLVSNFDEEELPLQKKVRENELIIEYGGDIVRAQEQAKHEYDTYQPTKGFVQFVTDVAMRPELVHSGASSRKFVIAFIRDYILDAYDSLIAEKRRDYPQTVKVRIPFMEGSVYECSTRDGRDEQSAIEAFGKFAQQVHDEGLTKIKMTPDEEGAKNVGYGLVIAGAVVAVLALAANMLFIILAIVLVVIGVTKINTYNGAVERVETERRNFEARYQQEETKAEAAIRNVMAEVVDYRSELRAHDAESEKVEALLGALNPEEYVQTLSGSPRKVLV